MNILQHKPTTVSVAGKGALKGYQRDPGSAMYHGDGIHDWRGHGGRHPTYSSVEFDRQLDKISMWLEKWNHNQRCQIIEIILRRSNHIQFQFLFTVMQPSLHRDFIYNAQSYFPSMDFKSISTPAARECQTGTSVSWSVQSLCAQLRGSVPEHVKDLTPVDSLRKLQLHRQDNYFREKSAHIHQDREAKHFAHENKQPLKLPKIPSGSSLTAADRQEQSTIKFKSKYLNLSNGSTTLPRIQQSVTLPKHHKSRASDERFHHDGVPSIASSTPVMRFVDMPVRRHIQDEGKMHYLGTSLTSVTSRTPSLSLPSPELPRQKRQDPFMRDHGGSGTFKDSKIMQRVNLDESLDAEAHCVIQWYEEWTDLRRNEFLHKLMLKLDQRQHFFLSSFLSVRQHRDFLALLPEDISLKILNYLSPNKILKCCLVSKTWYRLASNNQLWDWKCQEREILVPIPHNPWWKKIFRDNVQLINNWSTGSCRKLDLKGHTEQIEEIAFTHKLLASGSQDKTIKIWDLKTGQNIMTLRGHEKGVWCLNFFTDSLLISGSYDGTIKIWNLRNGQTAKTLLAHDGPVWSMVRHKETLVTTSQDKTAKVWNISQCLLKSTLTGHSAAVFAVDMNEDGSLVITGSADRTVRIWSTDTGVQKKVIWVSQTTSIMAVSYSKGYIACSYGETICLYKVEKTKLICTYQEHHKRIEALELKITDVDEDFGDLTGTLVSAGQDGLVKYWDIQKSTSTRTFKGHAGSVKAIRFDNLRIATAASDKVRIWDFTFYDKAEKTDRSEKSEKSVRSSKHNFETVEFKSETARSTILE